MSSIKRVQSFGWLLVIITTAFQTIVNFDMLNLICVAMIIAGYAVVAMFFLNKRTFERHPMSSFAVLGFAGTHLIFPLLFVSLEGKMVTYNLEVPIQTFGWTLLCLLTLTAVHLAYRNSKQMTRSRGWLQARPLKKLRVLAPPTIFQIWVMGILGLAAIFYIYYYSRGVGRVVSGPVDKLIQGIAPFTYSPFLMLASGVYGARLRSARFQQIALCVFTIVLFIVSLGRNSRGSFMMGFASPGFAYIIGYLLGTVPNKIFSFRNLVVLSGVLWLLTGPLADLATSMVMVRGQKRDVSPSKLISLTMEMYHDKEAIYRFRQQSNEAEKDWDEKYVTNVFLARFCNVKYVDNGIELASRLTPESRAEIFWFTWKRFLSTFPRPLIEALGLPADKDIVNAMSFGDKLYYEVTKDPRVLGGLRTGHFLGNGLAAFGVWFLPLFGLVSLPTFFLLDTFSIRRPLEGQASQLLGGNKRVLRANSQPMVTTIAFVGLLDIYTYFVLFFQESIAVNAAWVIRAWPQTILTYAVFAAICGFRFKRRNRSLNVVPPKPQLTE